MNGKNRLPRNWPDGRINAADDGETTMCVSPDKAKELVRIDFQTPVQWFAMNPNAAVKFAEALIKQARAVSSTPLTINLD